mmetsp:Transcript_138964/g.245564  ORF Transcript_138964/g.245564 Transcript_138964/m.245564 type:complete len:1660 (+) Transcript_138964:44-5023(+)
MGNLCMVWLFLVVAWRVPFASALPRTTESAIADEAPENDCRCWAGQGQCRANPAFMEKKCRASCLRQKSCDEWPEKVAKLQSRNSDLSSQIHKLKASDAVRREQKLKTEIADLQARLQQASNGNLDGQAPGAVCTSGTASTAAADKIQELTAHIASLEQQMQQKRAEEAAAVPPSAGSAAKAMERVEALKTQVADLEAQLQQKDRERKTEVDQLKVATFQAEDAKQEATKQIQALTSKIAELESRVEEKDQDKQGEIEKVKAAAGVAEKAATQKIQALTAQVLDLEGKLQQKAQEKKADQLRAEELQVHRRDEATADTIRKLNAQISDLKVQVHRKGGDRQEEIEQLRIKVMRAGVAAQEMTEKTQENEQLRAEALRAKMGRQADADRIKTLTVKVAELEATMRQREAEKQVAIDQAKTEASRAEAAEQSGAAKLEEMTKKVTEFEAQLEKDANNSKCDEKQPQADAASEALQLRVRELEVELLTQTAAYYQMSELKGTNATLNAGGADPWYALYKALLNLPSNVSQCIVALPANIKHFVRTASWAIMMGSADIVSQAWEAMKAAAASAWQSTIEGVEAAKVQAAIGWKASKEGFSQGVEATKTNAVSAANSAQEFCIAAANSMEQVARHPHTRIFFALSLMSIALLGWLRLLRSLNARILLRSTAGVQSAPCCERRMQRRALQEERSMQVLGIMAEKAVEAAKTPEESVEAKMPEKAAAAAEEKADELVTVRAEEGQAGTEATNEPTTTLGDAESAGPQRPPRQGSRVLAMAALVEAPTALKATEAFQQQMSALQAAQSLVDAAVGSMAMMCQEFKAAEAAKKKAAEEKMAAKAAAEKAVKDVLKLAAKKAAKEKQAAEAAARTVEAAALKLAAEAAAAQEAAAEASSQKVLEEVSEQKETAAAPSAAAVDMAGDARKVVEGEVAEEREVTAEGLLLPSLPSALPPIPEVAGVADKSVQEDIEAKAAMKEASAERAAGEAADEEAAIENTNLIEEQTMDEAVTRESEESLIGETAASSAMEESVAADLTLRKQAEGEADEKLASKEAPRLDQDIIQWLRKSHYVAGFLAYICVPVLLIACIVCLHMHGHLNTTYASVSHLWEVVSDQTVAYQRALGNATAGLALGMATVSVTTAPGVKQLLTTCEVVKSSSLNAVNHAWMTFTVDGNNHLSHLKLMVLCFGSVMTIWWLRWFRSLIALLQLQSCTKNSRIVEDGKIDSSSLPSLDSKVDSSYLPCPVFDMASDHVDEDESVSNQEEVKPGCTRRFRMMACACLACFICMTLIFTDLWSTASLYMGFLGKGLTEVVDRVIYEIGVFVVSLASNFNAKQLTAWWEQIGSLAGQAANQSWMVVTIALLQCVPCIGGTVAVIAWLKKRKVPSYPIDADLATDNQADVLSESTPSTLTGDVPCPMFDMALDESEDGVLTVAQDDSTQTFSLQEKPSVGSLKRYFRATGVACAYFACISLVCFVGLVFLACCFLACAWLHVHGYLAWEPYYEAFEWFSEAVSKKHATIVQAMEERIREMASEDGWKRITADLKNLAMDISVQALGNFTAVCLGVMIVLRWLKRRFVTTNKNAAMQELINEEDCRPVHAADSTADAIVHADPGDAPIKKVVEADLDFQVLGKAKGLENVHEIADGVPSGPFGLDVDTYVYHRLQA